jgi:DNA-binding response OmpR family regulator
MTVRIGLLEDDKDQGAVVKALLQNAGHICEHYLLASEFMRAVKRESFDLLILDWLLGETNGIEVLIWIRENIDWPIPVIFTTVMAQEEDIVRALQKGADDYMIKPLRERELVARINALARRASAREDVTTLECPPFVIDMANHRILREGVPLDLTQKEYELAAFLFKNIGRILSRGHILSTVWGRNPVINTRTVDTHISRIRTKLGLTTDPNWRLTSIYQHGYRMERSPAP